VTTEQDDLAAFSEIRAVVAWALTQLTTFEPPMEQLGDYVPASTFLGFPRRAKLLHLGEVWRLGIFLMNKEGTLFRAGDNTRVVETSHIQHVSTYRTERHELMDAAFRGGFPVGSVVNFNATEVLLDVENLASPGAPIFSRGPQAFVRWRAGAADDDAVLITDYMAERFELLLNPPQGATDKF